ncbi:hypothetical protein [Vulcanisaeta sp. JCM 16159]|uniref:hypothetical protein n=1 Tax=Vulcanisaeta sp. JCM 16159 TaxID=1295371 RepID=UPI001FB332AB|nr:hypothetical protein [Vulcanisaeta sp. JCM 16159]
MEPKPKGRSMVEVAGIKMSVVSNNSGTIVLRAWRRDYGEAKAIWERLKRAGYDAGLRPSKGGFWVYMSMSEVKKDPNLTAKICMVLERIHEETVNKGNIERAWSIAKAMMYLGCPAQGPRAQ